MDTKKTIPKITRQNSDLDVDSLNMVGYTPTSSKEEQKRALTWALLASYLPGGSPSKKKLLIFLFPLFFFFAVIAKAIK